MADDFFLTSGASVLNLGSYVDQDSGGADFGTRRLLETIYAENPGHAGGVPAWTRARERQFIFPLILPSSGSYAGIAGMESLLRIMAGRSGLRIDLRPDGTPSAEAVRFDVLHGRYEPAYNIRTQETGLRQGRLALTVQPFGYWPTEIVLSTSASVGLPGQLSIPGDSIIGDLPGLARLFFYPTDAGTTFPAGSCYTDALLWSLGARSPSFLSFWNPASYIVNIGQATLFADALAPNPTVVRIVEAGDFGATFQQVVSYRIDKSLEPAYRGRFRLFAWAKDTASSSIMWEISAHAGNPWGGDQPLATANLVATLPANFGASAMLIKSASPAYHLLDLGEITLPREASGASQSPLVSLWMKPGSAPHATGVIHIGGLYFFPLDGPNGIIPRGAMTPTLFMTQAAGQIPPTTMGLLADGIEDRVSLVGSVGPAHAAGPAGDARIWHRGDRPFVSPTTLQLDLCAGQRISTAGGTIPVIRAFPAYATNVHVDYRPRFLFLR